MFRDSDRGVNDVIAYVLLTGIIISTSVVILQTGTQAVTETRDKSGVGQAQTAISQFDSQTEIVARGGGVSHQSVSLKFVSGVDESLEIRDTGQIRIQTTNRSSGNKKDVYNKTIGTLLYESSEVEIAYQSGAVFQKRPRANSSYTTTLNHPPFQVSGNTLVMPIVRLDASAGAVADKSFTVTGQSPSDSGIPTPVSNKEVTVFVTSKYYQAWGNYFETQEQEDVEVKYYDDNETVAVTVAPDDPVVPEYNGTFISQSDIVVNSDACSDPTSCVAAGVSGHIETAGKFHGQTGDDENITENANLALGSETDYVYDKVSSARDSGNTSVGDDGNNVITEGKTLTDGTYYVKGIDYGEGMYSDTGTSSRTLTLDASSGDVTLVVDGDILLGTNAKIEAVSQSSNQVRIITTGDVLLGGYGNGITSENIKNTDIYGTAETDSMINSTLQAGLYAPTETPVSGSLAEYSDEDFCKGGSYDVCIGKNGNVNGSIVSGGFRVHNESSAGYTKPSASGVEIASVGPRNLYLQVSDNVVTVEDD